MRCSRCKNNRFRRLHLFCNFRLLFRRFAPSQNVCNYFSIIHYDGLLISVCRLCFDALRNTICLAAAVVTRYLRIHKVSNMSLCKSLQHKVKVKHSVQYTPQTVTDWVAFYLDVARIKSIFAVVSVTFSGKKAVMVSQLTWYWYWILSRLTLLLKLMISTNAFV